MTQPAVCCIICQSFPERTCALPPPHFALNFICKLFNLPAINSSLSEKLNKTPGNCCKLCKPCGALIQDALQTEKEIKALELKVKRMKDELWRRIIIASAQNSSQSDGIPPSVRAVGKYFIQCLGKCEVKLRRLGYDELKRKHNGKTEVLVEEAHNDFQDDMVIVPLYDENLLSPHDCSPVILDVETSTGIATELNDVSLSVPSDVDGQSVEDALLDEFKTEEDSEELDLLKESLVSPAEELNQLSAFLAHQTGPELPDPLAASELSLLPSTTEADAPPPPAEVHDPILAKGATSSVSVIPEINEPTKKRSPSRLASPKSGKKPRRKSGKYRRIKPWHEDGRRRSSRRGCVLKPECKYCGLKYDDYRKPSPVEAQTSGDPNSGTHSQYFYVCNPDVCCDRRYATPRQFSRHHRRNCRENPFVLKDRVSRIVPRHRCHECNKLYTTVGVLRNHLAEVHEKKYRFCCEICGAGLISASALERHMVKHLPEKAFKCDQCNKTYSRATSLRIHKRTHTGDVPYICEICGKGFHKQCRLPLHLENVHGEAKYPCDICGKMFRSRLYVGFHKKNVHGIKRTGGKKGSTDNCDDFQN